MERALRDGARALVVTARAQNPTGAVGERRRARASCGPFSREHPGVLLIEDDHGHAIVDLPVHPLAGATERWAFVRSVSKAYGPDLRLAVLTGDGLTVDRVTGRQRLGPGWVSGLLQRTVAHLWATGPSTRQWSPTPTGGAGTRSYGPWGSGASRRTGGPG